MRELQERGNLFRSQVAENTGQDEALDTPLPEMPLDPAEVMEIVGVDRL